MILKIVGLVAVIGAFSLACKTLIKGLNTDALYKTLFGALGVFFCFRWNGLSRRRFIWSVFHDRNSNGEGGLVI